MAILFAEHAKVIKQDEPLTAAEVLAALKTSLFS
jgi:hypothetical protein